VEFLLIRIQVAVVVEQEVLGLQVQVTLLAV
jgi:hypothetical protein